MKHPRAKPNLVHIAIECAGGRAAVASAFGISPQAVSGWAVRKAIPIEYLQPVCEMGGEILDARRVLAFSERARTDRSVARMTARIERATASTKASARAAAKAAAGASK